MTCRHVACDAAPYAHEVCKPHYERMMYRARARWSDERCTVTDCSSPPRTRGLCDMHYTRWRRHRSTDKPTRRVVGTCPDLSTVRDMALRLRDRDPKAARMLVDSALRGAA